MSPIRTEKQAEASRVNGAKSHGPVTPAGKRRASMNACTHGCYAQAPLLPWEDPRALDRTVQDYVDTYQPRNPVEYRLTVGLAHSDFRLQRGRAGEDAHLSLNVRAAPQRFDQDETNRSWRLFERLKVRHDDDYYPLTLARRLDAFRDGVRRQIEFWSTLVARECWHWGDYGVALPLLKLHAQWLETDAAVARLLWLLAASREGTNRCQFLSLCRECGAPTNPEWLDQAFERWNTEDIPTPEEANAALTALGRRELERLAALLPALEADHAARRLEAVRAATLDDTAANESRQRALTTLQRDYERAQKALTAQIKLRDLMNNDFEWIEESESPVEQPVATPPATTPDQAETPAAPPAASIPTAVADPAPGTLPAASEEVPPSAIAPPADRPEAAPHNRQDE